MERKRSSETCSRETLTIRRQTSIAVAALLFFILAAFASGARDDTSVTTCGSKPYSYAGVQAATTARGISATLVAVIPPAVVSGHVGAWIGLGGTRTGPGGTPEWIQVGLAAFASGQTESYYEITQVGAEPRFVRLNANVVAQQHFALVEMMHRPSWWRVWVNSKAVSSPIHLPGSDDTWYPQAVAESWNGTTEACNSYSFRFSSVSLAEGAANRLTWRPVERGYVFQDAGYRVTPISSSPRDFLAASIAA
jgi:hypothetical protein